MSIKAIILTLTLAACTTVERDVVNAAQSMGFKDVKVGDTAMFACGKNDYIGRRFTATNINGASVSGVVCCGMFKGCTVRF